MIKKNLIKATIVLGILALCTIIGGSMVLKKIPKETQEHADAFVIWIFASSAFTVLTFILIILWARWSYYDNKTGHPRNIIQISG